MKNQRLKVMAVTTDYFSDRANFWDGLYMGVFLSGAVLLISWIYTLVN